MRRSREDTADSRQRIVSQAARLLRQNGIDRLGVAEVMQAAGMTHGGFYRHFTSREALVAEAINAAFDDTPSVGEPYEKSPSRKGIGDYVDRYLSLGHVEQPEIGCPIAAVGCEIGRAADDARKAFSQRAEDHIASLFDSLQAIPGAERADAIQLLATLIGAVVLARSVQDETTRADILKAARDGIEHLITR
jgi:TetR/AcrR family transcriptional regulator, transcriptional repressor for nem operon